METNDTSKENLKIIALTVEAGFFDLTPEIKAAFDEIRGKFDSILIEIVSEALEKVEQLGEEILANILAPDDNYISDISFGIKADTHNLLKQMLSLRNADSVVRHEKREFAEYFSEIIFKELNKRREEGISEASARRSFQKVLENRLIEAISVGESFAEIEIEFYTFVLGLLNMMHNAIAAQVEMLFSYKEGALLGDNDDERMETIRNTLIVALSGIEQIKRFRRWVDLKQR